MGFRHFCRPGVRAKLLRGERVHWLENSRRADYIRRVAISAPDWMDRGDLVMLAAWAKAMHAFTGVEHDIDHIVPLRHPLVSGLTVPANLRVIPKKSNNSKGNTWQPDQLELPFPKGKNHEPFHPAGLPTPERSEGRVRRTLCEGSRASRAENESAPAGRYQPTDAPRAVEATDAPAD